MPMEEEAGAGDDDGEDIGDDSGSDDEEGDGDGTALNGELATAINTSTVGLATS
jgi:hypothetical protein